MIGKLKDLTINRDGTQNITVTVQSDFRELFDELYDKDIDIEIKKYCKRRSLDSNNLAWALIDKLAVKLQKSKTEIYQEAIRDIGGVSEVVCVRDIAVDTLCRGWASKGLGWQCKKEPSKIPGCTNVTLYWGSSLYTTKQMSDLINILVQECNQHGIPTITQNEIDKSLAVWARKNG